jgi:hypothetical protein
LKNRCLRALKSYRFKIFLNNNNNNKKSDEFTDLSAIETSHGHVKRGGVVLLRPSLLIVKKKGFARVLHNADIAVGNCDELLAPCDCTVE